MNTSMIHVFTNVKPFRIGKDVLVLALMLAIAKTIQNYNICNSLNDHEEIKAHTPLNREEELF